MSTLDWIVLLCSTALIVAYGIWKTRKSTNIDSYLLAGHSTPWWTIGLSVMATQASAITFLSIPGQAFTSGMGFVQLYFGLPIAMVIISVLFIPRYFGLKVFTVYEFLEKRFDVRVRLLTAFIFLVQRGLGSAITIFAPAIIMSSILGWNLNLTIILIGAVVTFYTAFGGTNAVSASHQLQMAVMIGGMIVAFMVTLHALPPHIHFTDAMRLAGFNHKLNLVNFNLDLHSRYTFWSGIVGGTFLATAYFGTDQSQAQRYISGHSIRDSRLGLLFNGVFKVPMQFFILLCGVMVYVFYQFQPSPVFFNTVGERKIMETSASTEFLNLQKEWDQEQLQRENLYDGLLKNGSTGFEQKLLDASIEKEKKIRAEAQALIKRHVPEIESNDQDYVFLRFILDYLPPGLIGLLITAILAAGMSATASGINALASTSTIDFYKRLIRKEAPDKHFVLMSRIFTMAWGIIAIGFACFGSLFENLIQFVNIVGSIFYGPILGIFLATFFRKGISSTAVFISAIIAQLIVLAVFKFTILGFLWYIVIGCIAVITIGLLVEWVILRPMKMMSR
ncbi:MAG TPA: sodium:solute symporter [Saprospiraceae bacterium]|nr:sodium:solute symporter [Saprospiraceae bacterium]